MAAKFRRPLAAYVLAIGILFIIGLLAAALWDRRIIDDIFRGLKGGIAGGLLLAYLGSLLLVGAKGYTIVKRVGVASLIGKLGGARLWLNTHISLSTIGFVVVSIHAGFPLHFEYDALFEHGFAGLATWLLFVAAASRSLRPLRVRKTSPHAESFQLLEASP